MKLKLHNFEIKKQEYKKHLERLSNIYSMQKGKQKILTQTKSVEKLMAITHRLHGTSNKFKVKNNQLTEKLSTSKDWSLVNSSFDGFKDKKQKVKHRNLKLRNQFKEIEKENQTLFFRLMKVKPTIETSKLENEFKTTKRNYFIKNMNKTQQDFSSILNASIIRPIQTKKIQLKLHSHNQQVLKIKFSDQIKDILNSQKLYLIATKNNKENIVETECFSVKELIESQLCIYKQKNQQISYLEIQQLFNDSKMITKGFLVIEQKQNTRNQQLRCWTEKIIQFVTPNKKIILLKVNFEKRNLKPKIKTKRNQVCLKNKIQESEAKKQNANCMKVNQKTNGITNQ